jgi:zinc transporter ZupT
VGLQRIYAFVVLTLRDFFRPAADRFYELKATFVIVVSQGLLVVAALYAASAVRGHLLEVLGDRKRFGGFTLVLAAALYFVNAGAQAVVIPRFEPEYLAQQPRSKRLTTIAVLSGLAFVFACWALARYAATGRK